MTTALGLDKAFVGNIGPHQVDLLGEILDAAIVGLKGDSRLLGCAILIIDRVLIAYQLLATSINIGACEMALATLCIVEFEGTIQLQVIIGIATRIAVLVIRMIICSSIVPSNSTINRDARAISQAPMLMPVAKSWYAMRTLSIMSMAHPRSLLLPLRPIMAASRISPRRST